MTIDFITGLSRMSSYDNVIWFIVDRLTKSVHFLTVKTINSISKLVQSYVKEIIQLHGVPASVVSDNDPYFTSQFLGKFSRNSCLQLVLQYCLLSIN